MKYKNIIKGKKRDLHLPANLEQSRFQSTFVCGISGSGKTSMLFEPMMAKDLEKKLWEAADKMRGAVPVSSYKFIILGLIFLKYISYY